jgi:predicted nucleic acid-binding protein
VTQILIDTCILIDYSKNHTHAINYLEQLAQPPAISALTVTEIMTGIRNTREQQLFADLFNVFKVLSVTYEIAEQAGLYRQRYFKSHQVGVVDAIIAATAVIHALEIVTLNIKHFPMIQGIVKPY